jgi:hypothetical protein
MTRMTNFPGEAQHVRRDSASATAARADGDDCIDAAGPADHHLLAHSQASAACGHIRSYSRTLYQVAPEASSRPYCAKYLRVLKQGNGREDERRLPRKTPLNLVPSSFFHLPPSPWRVFCGATDPPRQTAPRLLPGAALQPLPLPQKPRRLDRSSLFLGKAGQAAPPRPAPSAHCRPPTGRPPAGPWSRWELLFATQTHKPRVVE